MIEFDAAADNKSGLTDRAHGCLVGGLIGDAMGTPSEGLEPEEIERRFGWIEDFEGDGTDDSIMKYLLADALVASDGNADADAWAVEWLRRRGSVGGDKADRFFASVLHAAAKLRYGVLPRRVAAGHMPSSTAAMSIAPVGIVNAGHPRAAAAQAQEIASLVHGDETGFCQDGAVAIAACVATAMAPDASLERVIAAATAQIKPWSGRETVPASIALVRLAGGDLPRTLCYAANFGRDTDTIACMAGSIAGALAGASGIPAAWLAKAARNASRDQQALARTLVDVARRKAARETAAWRLLAESPG